MKLAKQYQRWILTLAGCVILVGLLNAQEAEPRTYVLVHGGWGSVENWSLVEPLLNQHGHRVYLASLTGHGDREHLQSPEVTLETHVLDVANMIEVRDLTDVYLVGHSYGGMVITGAWDRVRDRIKHVVYVDAFLPADGKALADYAEPPGIFQELAADMGGMVPVSTPRCLQSEECRNDPDRPLQSLRTFIDPVKFVNGSLPVETARTYIRALGTPEREPSPTFTQFADWVRNDPAWDYLEINSPHGVPRWEPEGLVQILLSLD